MKSTRARTFVVGVAVILGAFLTENLLAQQIERTNAGAKKLGKEQIIDALFVDLDVAKKRGIQPMRSLSMEIQFKRNSAKLDASAKEALRPLGEALNSEYLGPQAFVIEGHTDITGAREYNKWLSEQRAKAVKSYLADEFSISPARLKTVGKGPDDLLDQSDPASGVNRRVEILTSYQ